jgi:hypothetical protein
MTFATYQPNSSHDSLYRKWFATIFDNSAHFPSINERQ